MITNYYDRVINIKNELIRKIFYNLLRLKYYKSLL